MYSLSVSTWTSCRASCQCGASLAHSTVSCDEVTGRKTLSCAAQQIGARVLGAMCLSHKWPLLYHGQHLASLSVGIGAKRDVPCADHRTMISRNSLQ